MNPARKINMRVTHTYAVLEVSANAFEEIKTKLEAAGYQDQIHIDGDKVLIDMHGLALSKPEIQSEPFHTLLTAVKTGNLPSTTPK